MSKTDRKYMDYKKAVICGDRLLVRIRSAEEMTAGGIILPDQAQAERKISEVIKIGDEYGGTAGLGDDVLCSVHALSSFATEDEFGPGMHIVNRKDVMAIFPKEKPDA
ncbi:hypothetical protein LCGC14_1051470 [marine sediment metagenome]|uniref:10 kDa chaperonin n=1 Tax=marine sediment metagenome TaxID=412755 RepID=A0A0F9QUR6_9ZZZZ